MSKINSYTQLIENTLARQDFDREPENLYEPIAYILKLGGKRLRPALCLAGCELVGGTVQDAIMPALGIEVFHNFSLLHDDIMDEAPIRRGRPSVHKKWSVNAAILSGDAMLVKSFQYISHVDKAILPKVLRSFSQTAMEVCEGQQHDLDFEKRTDVSEEEYLEMIRLKTSVLLGCALKTGALVGKAKASVADHLYRFGENIGIAFQIQDDLLDSFGKPEKVGKTAGGDILKHKQTLLMIHAREQDAPRLSEALQASGSSEEKVENILKLFEELGSKEYASSRRDEYYEKALANLEQVEGDAEIKSELANFATWLIKREN